MHDPDRPTPPTPDTAPSDTALPSAARARTAEQLRALGVTTDLMTAAKVLRVARTAAYTGARNGTFPVPVVRTGRRYRVVVARLIEFLGLDEEPRS